MVATQDVLKVSVALGVAAVAVYFALFGRSPKIELGAYEALGAVTAEETAQLVGGRGQVLVIARDTGPDKIPSVESQMATFERTLRAHGGLTQVTRRFQATAMTMMATGGGCLRTTWPRRFRPIRTPLHWCSSAGSHRCRTRKWGRCGSGG